MKIKQGFISNSSSASFMVGIPVPDRDLVLETLFYQLRYEYFDKYYLGLAIKESIAFSEKRLKEATEEYNTTANTPKEDRMEGKNKTYDPLSHKEFSMKQWQKANDRDKAFLDTLEKIDSEDKKELVEFGLRYYGIGFAPMYNKQPKETTADYETDPSKTVEDLVESEIIGYQLSDWVSMFNEYGDIPKVLRNMTGVLSFVYPDLKCWVEEDYF